MENLAAFAHDTTFPDPVIEQSKKAFANWFSVTVHGAHTTGGKKLISFAKGFGPGDSLLIGTKERALPQIAALTNSANGHIDDYDDTHLPTITHPVTPVLGAVCSSISEETTGLDFLRALAVGAEATIRVALALNFSHYERGWHSTATTGGIGAALAAGRLMHLDKGKLATAGALAGLQPIGLRAAFGTTGKSFQVGRASEAGYSSARASQHGLDAPLDVLENQYGLRITSTNFDIEALANLGSRWEFLNDTFKPYPCGVVVHPIIDAGRAFFQNRLSVDEIEKIDARVNPLVTELTGASRPDSALKTKFSAQYLLALSLSEGTVALRHFERGPSKTILNLADRVNLIDDVSVQRDSANVEILLKSGTKLNTKINHVRGSSENQITWKDLYGKFVECIGPSLARSETLWSRFISIDKESSIQEFLHDVVFAAAVA